MVCIKVAYFLKQVIVGITGDTLCCDHHFQVPGRIKQLDHVQQEAYTPYYALYGLMSSRNQILSLTYAATTSQNERIKIGEEIIERFRSQHQTMPYLFTDSCCRDSSWIRENLKDNEEIQVFLDNYHLLSRYRNALPKTSPLKTKEFMQRLAMLLCGSITQMSKMEAGPVIYSKVDDLISRYQDMESQHENDDKIITPALLKVNIHLSIYLHLLGSRESKDSF